MTAHERTGWRDQWPSERHRLWGAGCPSVDIDWLVVEYTFGRPVALVEYKRYTAQIPDLRHANYQALITLANNSGIPFFWAFYWPDCAAFKVYPVNDQAFQWFRDGELMTEREYVGRIYAMRQQALSAFVQSRLRDDLPGWQTDADLWDAEGSCS
jgi:hypothetical protein